MAALKYGYDWLSSWSVQFSFSVMSAFLRPHGYSIPGFPVHHQLVYLGQTHVHRVDDAIQQSHPLSSPSSPTFNLLQHQGLFRWVSSSHQVAKVLELQHQSSNEYWGLIYFRIDWLILLVQGTLNSLLQHHISKVIGHWWLTQPPASFPYLEVRGWGWKFQPYNLLMDSSYSQFSILAGLLEVTLLTNSGVVERDLIWITKDSPLIFIAVKIF